MSSIAFIQKKFDNCSVVGIKKCINAKSKYINWQEKGEAIFVSVDCFAKKCGMSGRRCDEIIFHEVRKGTDTRLNVFLIEEKGHSREVEDAISQLQASAKIIEKFIKERDYHNFQPVISCKKMSSLRRHTTKTKMHNKNKLALVVLKSENFTISHNAL